MARASHWQFGQQNEHERNTLTVHGSRTAEGSKSKGARTQRRERLRYSASSHIPAMRHKPVKLLQALLGPVLLDKGNGHDNDDRLQWTRKGYMVRIGKRRDYVLLAQDQASDQHLLRLSNRASARSHPGLPVITSSSGHCHYTHS